MNRTRITLMVTAVAALAVAPLLLAQSPAAAQHPSFAGTWQPSEPAKSDRLFDVGLTAIPGGGRLTIEQRTDRLTVRITMPDDRLDPILDINGRFYETIVYRVPAASGRSGGFGAAGPPTPVGVTWVGDQLVIPSARPDARFPGKTTFSIDGDRLKLETRRQISDDRASTVTEWFTRV